MKDLHAKKYSKGEGGEEEGDEEMAPNTPNPIELKR